jgi:hypothetical protein
MVVDLTAEFGHRLVPFEVKYEDAEVTIKRPKGMRLFLEERKVQRGYVITQRWDAFKVLDVTSARTGQQHAKLDAQILSIPAPAGLLLVVGVMGPAIDAPHRKSCLSSARPGGSARLP